MQHRRYQLTVNSQTHNVLNRPVIYRIFLIVKLLSINTVFGQRFPIREFSIPDGLSNSYIISLGQDPSGRVWVGTGTGLNVFNGEAFQTITPTPFRDDQRVLSIMFLPNSTPIFFNQEGIIEYHKGKSTFTALDFIICGPIVDDQSQIWSMGYMWAAFQGNELYCIKHGKSERVTEKYLPKGQHILHGIAADRANKRVLIMSETNQCYEIKNGKSRLLNEFKGPGLRWLFNSTDGRPYCFAGRTLYRLEGSQWVRLYDLPEETILEQSANNIHSISVGKNGDICYHDGLNVKHFDGKTLSVFPINNPYVFCTYIDNSNNIWIGTNVRLYYVRSEIFSYYSSQEGYQPSAYTVNEAKDGKIYLGNFAFKDGIQRLEGNQFVRDQRIDKLPSIQQDLRMTEGTLRDHEGNLLFFSVTRGWIFYDGRTFKTFGDSTDYIYSSFDDTTHHRYLLANNGGDLYSIDKKSLKINKHYKFLDAYLACFEKDKLGRYWVGTDHNETYIWNGQDTTYKVWRGIPSRRTNQILKDHRGNLWFATTDGLFLYDYHQVIKIAPGLWKKRIRWIHFLNDQYLLLGMLDGMHVLDVKNFYEKHEIWTQFFDPWNGFVGTACVFRGMHEDTKGNIWVMTSEGLIKFSKQNLLRSLKNIPGGIVSFINAENGRVIPASGGEIRLASNLRRLRVQLQQPSVNNILENSLYRYKLERTDQNATAEWSEPVRDNELTFNNLSDGNYRLSVRIVRGHGLWQVKTYTQDFEVLPFWWNTWWARATALAMLLTVFFYWRTRQIAKKVAEKEEQLLSKQLLAEAQSQQSQLQLKAITNQIDPHFVSNFLTAIQSMVYEKDPDTVVTYLAKFGKIFRDQLMSKQKVFWTLEEEINFVRNYLELEQLRFGEKIRENSVIDKSLSLHDIIVPKMLIQGYVANAIKHGLDHKPGGGTVRIQLKNEDPYLLITVEDDGIGIEASKKIRRRFSTGQGLKINEAIFKDLNQRNELKTRQQITDLGHDNLSTGVRVEVWLPLRLKLPTQVGVESSSNEVS